MVAAKGILKKIYLKVPHPNDDKMNILKKQIPVFCLLFSKTDLISTPCIKMFLKLP